jgi:ectoine hydroxylase-related dioxygenase (phytanoyl-CoA dioxygenase family)
MSSVKIPDSLVDEFERRGAVCLRAVFAQSWLDKLADGVDKNFADPGPEHTVYTRKGEPGGFYDDYCNWQRIVEYRDFVMNSPAAEIAARLMQSKTARIYHDHVLVKEPGTRVDGNQLCSIWLPLDKVPKSACPEFVAGSQASGVLYYPRLFIDHEDYAQDQPGFETIPDIDAQRSEIDLLSWDMQLGDCIVFHMRTIHGAPATTGLKSRRRGFSTRWLGDDARFAIRPWATSPPFKEVNLEPGEVMEHPSFPVAWPV